MLVNLMAASQNHLTETQEDLAESPFFELL